MTEKKRPPARPTAVSKAKKDMLEGYGDLTKELDARRVEEARPEERLAEAKIEKSVQIAEALAVDGVAREIGSLRSEVGRVLAGLSDQIEAEVDKYRSVRAAVAAKEKELLEIYEIQKTASGLTALLELQQTKREEFEQEMAAEKENLGKEIETTRTAWDSERVSREVELKEREAQEKRRRDREKEEYEYAFKREKEQARAKLDDELASLQREVERKKTNLGEELAERERAITTREEEIKALRARAEALPKEIEATTAMAVKETTDRLRAEAANKEALQQKSFEGERAVHVSRIESLERTVAEQAARIEKMTGQLEKSYGQVQEIAVRAIEGSSASKSLANLQQMLAEQGRKGPGEK